MEHYLKITDKAVIEAPLELSTEYQFTGVVTVGAVKQKPDEEGEFDYTYDAKFTSHLTLIKGDKTLIKGRDKKSMSVKLRGAIYHLQDEVEKLDKDEEQFYNEVMGMVIGNIHEIYQRYKV